MAGIPDDHTRKLQVQVQCTLKLKNHQTHIFLTPN